MVGAALFNAVKSLLYLKSRKDSDRLEFRWQQLRNDATRNALLKLFARACCNTLNLRYHSRKSSQRNCPTCVIAIVNPVTGISTIREALDEYNDSVFTSLHSLSVVDDYFWHERESKFTVDGALRKHPAFAENQQDVSDRLCPDALRSPRTHEN